MDNHVATAPIISVSQLKDLLNKPYTVVLDCRFSLADTTLGERQYQEGHIPGAYYFHLDRDLSGAKGPHGGRHPLPDPEALTQKLRQAGVNDKTPVVIYDDSRFGFAARAWWLLRYLGHEECYILDGGFKAWCAAGMTVDRRIPAEKSGRFTPQVNSDWLLSCDDIRAALDSGAYTLVDSREAKRYQGLEEPIDPIAGHIPGALNFPWQEVTNDRGYLKSHSNHSERWLSVKDQPLAVYCGSGVTACVNLLSLYIAGIPAKLYAGSWSDWCSYEDTPKVTAPAASEDN